MDPSQFQRNLLIWFEQHGRHDLPWQQNKTPYHVWVSEIMLQQTQVNTVIPYYQKFIQRFPDVDQLAQAHLDEVLQHWSGLGYYARARNLHKSAQIIHQQGYFPEDLDSLIELPGIGRSTAGAILSLALQQHHPILDGNVKRVLAHFSGIHGWTGDNKIQQELWHLSHHYTPNNRTDDFNQAMMDLGSMICKRSKPLCHSCPLNSQCYALLQNKTTELPTPKPKQKIPSRQCYFLILSNRQQQLFLYQRAPSGIWGGLWSFPQFNSLDELQDWCLLKQTNETTFNFLNQQRHTFSHFHLDYTPVIVENIHSENQIHESGGGSWFNPAQTQSLGLPAPIKRLIESLN